MFFLKNRGVTSAKEATSLPSQSGPRRNGRGFFLFKSSQGLDLYSGPDFLYENEAWAPDNQQNKALK